MFVLFLECSRTYMYLFIIFLLLFFFLFKTPKTNLNRFSGGPGRELHPPACHTPPPPPPPTPAPPGHGRVFRLARPVWKWTSKNPSRPHGASCVVSLSRLRFRGKGLRNSRNNASTRVTFGASRNLVCKISFICPRFDTPCTPECHLPRTSLSASAAS